MPTKSEVHAKIVEQLLACREMCDGAASDSAAGIFTQLTDSNIPALRELDGAEDFDPLLRFAQKMTRIEGCECDSYHGHTCALCKVRRGAFEALADRGKSEPGKPCRARQSGDRRISN